MHGATKVQLILLARGQCQLSDLLRIKKKIKTREDRERTDTTRNVESRWCLRGTHSAAALAIYFREVFSLKRTQVQRNK